MFPSIDGYQRKLYFLLNGITSLSLLYFWIPSHIVLWKMDYFSSLVARQISFLVFGVLQLCIIIPMYFIGINDFIGITEVKEFGPESKKIKHFSLRTNGIYGMARHPMYTITIGAYLISGIFFLSLDRVVLLVSIAIYLVVAVPYEEKQLIQIFGDDYVNYSKKVPAVVPRIF